METPINQSEINTTSSISTEDVMRVTKRNGELEDIKFDKILKRVKKIGQEANIQINYTSLVIKVIDQLYDKIHTTKIDELTAEQCASLSTQHPNYGILASRIIISNHQKNTVASFSSVMNTLYNNVDIHGIHKPIISEQMWNIVSNNKEIIDNMIQYDRDYLIDYFGFKTLERAYLFKCNKQTVERPQHMWLRVALCIHGNNLDLVKETYDLMSLKYFTHATPTLFNAGISRPQLSSCYLIAMESDSVNGIFNTLKDCANISKWSGGIGLHIHNIRAKNSHINGTNGSTNGIVPMLRVYNNTARYIDQGGKRNGSFAIYLEPWHADVEDFLEMKKNQGDEELKARDLFYALWIPDLFMNKIKNNEKWCLFCPNECPGLSDVYGDEFQQLYEKYESQGLARKVVQARDLWFRILDAQMETGTPYLLYKDAANKKSNQKNLGTIKSSNLCVAPETLILTCEGYKKIKDLNGMNVDIWNGEEWSNVKVRKTGENKELIEVKTSDGCVLNCTPYHKFYIRESISKHSILMKEAKDLKPNDKIIKSSFPIIDGTEKIDYPYIRGFTCVNEKNDNVKELISDYLKISSERLLNDKDISKNYYVPINCSISDKMKWISGFCDSIGNVLNNETNQQIELLHKNKELLMKLKLLLQTCGVNSNVTNDILIDSSYSLLISHSDLQHLVNLGFNPKILKIDLFQTYIDINMNRIISNEDFNTVSIVSVENNGRIDDTYCFTEPNRHMGVFNGILTGQCTEIIEYSNDKETAVCNLASIGLPTFVSQETKTFDYEKLHSVTKVITRNLNRIIDVNFYPTEKTRRSNLLHRPIGIGVQGLSDTFIMMDIAYHSEDAKKINKMIFETIYHAALEASNEISIERKDSMNIVINDIKLMMESRLTESLYEERADVTVPPSTHVSLTKFKELNPIYAEAIRLKDYPSLQGSYSSFVGSPASKGELQYDLWGVEPTPGRYDWDSLKESIKNYGLRNSLLIAPMPTASTSQILGFNECFEPLTSNIYSRRTLAGEFIVVNKYLMNELIGLGLWNEKVKNNIIANKGSVQQLDFLPEHIRNKYKIVWEIPMRHLIDMSADRGAFICQSQSLNLWVEDPTYNILTSMHFYSWNKGLKTGIYYLRRKAKHTAQQFTIEPEKKEMDTENEKDEICEMCSA
jgi:ribonucleoside-diphosphate reductase alpha chain